jgi:hypothetical protein
MQRQSKRRISPAAALMLRALITYRCRCVTKMKQLSSKQEHEIAVADRLVKDLAVRATFVRTGDPVSNEPDVIYSCENQLLGIEVRHAYYSESFAKGEWDAARGKIEVPPGGAVVRIWDLDNADDTICAEIQHTIEVKCARKPYTGVDRVWLCVVQQALLSGQCDVVRECVKRLVVPPTHQFKKIFLHYGSPLHEGDHGHWEWHSIQVWPQSA